MQPTAVSDAVLAEWWKAAAAADVKTAQRLLQDPATKAVLNVNCFRRSDVDRLNALGVACDSAGTGDCVEFATLMLAHGAVNKIWRFAGSAICRAAHLDKARVVRALVQAGAPIADTDSDGSGKQPLHLAARKGSLSLFHSFSLK
jgi:hypothetical protein